MFCITTRVDFPREHREAVVDFGRALLAVLERQPGLLGVDYLETRAGTATEMRSRWQTESDYQVWMSSEAYSALFGAPGAFDFEGCTFSSEEFEPL